MADAPPRVLFLSARYPFPPRRGDQVRVFHLVRGLAKHVTLTLLTFGDGDPLPVDGVAVKTVARGLPRSLGANLASPRPSLPLQVRLYLDGAMRAAVRRELASGQDVIHASLARMGPYLALSDAETHTHLDLVDALGANMRSRSRLTGGLRGAPFALEGRLMSRYEATLASSADSCSVVAEADRAALGPAGERVAVLPNGVDFSALPFAEPSGRPSRLIFFGNLGYFHNARAAEYVATRVLPLVRAQLPEVTLRLVGARPTSQVRGLDSIPGVELRSDVPEMRPELQGAAVAVLPLFSGTGIKNKVLEAFATGTAVVTNRLGIEGVQGARNGVHYLEAEGAEAISAACVSLFGDAAARTRVAAAARVLVEEQYGWDRQVSRLLALYGLPVA